MYTKNKFKFPTKILSALSFLFLVSASVYAGPFENVNSASDPVLGNAERIDDCVTNNRNARGSNGLARPLNGPAYYIAEAPLGNDDNTGASDSPLATFAEAFSRMEADGVRTLYIMDGAYHQQIKGMPSGSPDNWTKIYALHDHAVEIDGQETIAANSWEALLYIEGKSYVEIRGLKVHHSAPTCSVLGITDSNNITVRVSGFWQASTDKDVTPVKIGNSSYVLLEDVWAFGRGRYSVVLGADTTKSTLRRVVTRWGDGAYSGRPIAGFSVYKGYDNLLENCITLDHNTHPEWHTAGHHGFYNISWHTDLPESRNNRFLGCIALNLTGATGYTNQTYAQPDDDNNFFENCIAVDSSRGHSNNSASRNSTIKNFTALNNAGVGLFNSTDSVNTTFLNCLSVGNGNSGFWNNYGDLSGSYLGAFDNGATAFRGFDPDPTIELDPELKYLLRIEAQSPYDGTGQSGEDIGANVIKRYIDGELTADNLWPWPYEDWIKEDMGSISQRGFCAGGTQLNGIEPITLTSYVWEYLGTPIPGEVYGNSGMPRCLITSPTSDASYDNGPQSSITIAGTANGNTGIRRVAWENQATSESGDAVGTATWTAANISLVEGDNLIVITAFDAGDQSSEDRITVRRTTDEPQNPGSGTSDGSSGGCFISYLMHNTERQISETEIANH